MSCAKKRKRSAGAPTTCATSTTGWISLPVRNEFSEAADPLHVSALTEIGLVLFTITLIVNLLSRLLIWSMERGAQGPVVATPATEEAAA